MLMRKREKRKQTDYGLLKICVYESLCPTVVFDVETQKIYYRNEEGYNWKNLPAKSIMCELSHSGNTGLPYNNQQLNE